MAWSNGKIYLFSDIKTIYPSFYWPTWVVHLSVKYHETMKNQEITHHERDRAINRMNLRGDIEVGIFWQGILNNDD